MNGAGSGWVKIIAQPNPYFEFWEVLNDGKI